MYLLSADADAVTHWKYSFRQDTPGICRKHFPRDTSCPRALVRVYFWRRVHEYSASSAQCNVNRARVFSPVTERVYACTHASARNTYVYAYIFRSFLVVLKFAHGRKLRARSQRSRARARADDVNGISPAIRRRYTSAPPCKHGRTIATWSQHRSCNSGGTAALFSQRPAPFNPFAPYSVFRFPLNVPLLCCK